MGGRWSSHCYPGDHACKEVSGVEDAILYYDFKVFSECLCIIILEFLLCGFVLKKFGDFMECVICIDVKSWGCGPL